MKWIRWFGTRCGALALVLSMVLPGLAAHGQAEVQVEVLPDQLNVREQPGFEAAIIGYYPRGTTLHISGWDGTVWVFATPLSGDVTGWVHWDYVDFPAGFEVGTLPLITATGAAGTTSAPSPAENAAPAHTGTQGLFPDSVIPTTISPRMHEVFLRGQELGNRADVFVKVGDSISEAPKFLTPIGLDMYELGAYQSLSATIDYFSRTPARTGNSFANQSAAVHGGWTSHDVITPAPHFLPNVCGDEIPLLCEYRVSRPAVALIMIGTNDISFGLEAIHYRHNLERIVYLSLHYGVIPVLSTLPENHTSEEDNAAVRAYNHVIHQVAAEFEVPLWNYGLAMHFLPRQGLSGDGIHPSYNLMASEYSTAVFTPDYLEYGYNMRNLTALLTLEAVWRGAMY